jgi:two-component system chemotaxis response regulator CheY
MPPHSLHAFNILIVDDELLIRNLVRGVLTSLGFTNVTEANSGRKALEQIASNKFDFIITDWRMDDLDGIDIVHHIRKSQTPPLCNTPIIMLTGNTEASYVKTAISAGINGYLIKPFSAEQLVKRIRAVIEAPRDFIISKNFTGPDRRHINQPPPEGMDRRKKRKKK